MRIRSSIQPYVVCSLLAAACGGDDDGESPGSSRGTLVVKYQLGNNRTCDSLGVKSVKAVLNGKEYPDEAPCENYELRFRDLPAGSYRVELFGVDQDGVEIMDSIDQPDTVVNLPGGDQTVVVKPDVKLSAAPAHLKVRWSFGFGTCKGAGIDSFEIALWGASGLQEVLGDTLDCLAEGEGREQYREIDDPDRNFRGDEPGEVSVQALDKNSVDIGPAAVFKFKAPGPGHDLKVTVNCESNSCTGTGKPD